MSFWHDQKSSPHPPTHFNIMTTMAIIVVTLFVWETLVRSLIIDRD
jgi:hypothetical protein